MKRIAGFLLVGLGFVLSVVNAYIYGVAEGHKGSPGADLSHIHFVQEGTLAGFCAGALIFVIGYVLLLFKDTGKTDSA